MVVWILILAVAAILAAALHIVAAGAQTLYEERILAALLKNPATLNVAGSLNTFADVSQRPITLLPARRRPTLSIPMPVVVGARPTGWSCWFTPPVAGAKSPAVRFCEA